MSCQGGARRSPELSFPRPLVPAESGNPGQGRMRGASPCPPFTRPLVVPRSPPLVVPAKAGTQGRGGPGRPPSPSLHDPSRRSSALVVPAKAGTQGRGGRAGRPRPHPSLTPPSFPDPSRRSRESGNPGQGRMRGASPSPPFTTPLVVPRSPPRSSFPRKPEPSAGRGAGASPTPPTTTEAPLHTEGGPKFALTKSGARLRDDHPVARRVEPVALAALDRPA